MREFLYFIAILILLEAAGSVVVSEIKKCPFDVATQPHQACQSN